MENQFISNENNRETSGIVPVSGSEIIDSATGKKEEWKEKDEMFERPSLNFSEDMAPEISIPIPPEKKPDNTQESIKYLLKLDRERKKAKDNLDQAELSSQRDPDQESLDKVNKAIGKYRNAHALYKDEIEKVAFQTNTTPGEVIKRLNQSDPDSETRIQSAPKPEPAPINLPKNPNSNIIDVEVKVIENSPKTPAPEKETGLLERTKEKILSFIKKKEAENEEKEALLSPAKKSLFKKLVSLSKSKTFQVAIGTAIIGISIIVPPVGAAALITGGAGFLPVEFGIPMKVLGGAVGGSLFRKILEKKKTDANKNPENKNPEPAPQTPAPAPEQAPIVPQTPAPAPEQAPIVIPEQKDKSKLSKKEKINDNLEEIRKTITEQPESIQNMFSEMKNKFESIATIDNKEFMFASNNEGKILALVKDLADPKSKWKTRFFRYSGSDHQWKSLPGENPYTYLKGQEDNELHHYVQSAKISKELHEELENVSQANTYNYSAYIPKEVILSGKKEWQFEKEFEFKENSLELKNPEWNKAQKDLQQIYKRFDALITKNLLASNIPEGSSYKLISEIETPGFKQLKESLDRCSQTQEFKDLINNHNDGDVSKFQLLKTSANPELQNLAKQYEETIGSYFEEQFKTPLPESMIPDFSKESLNSYDKGKLSIEEYKATNKEGDELIFSMARDEEGRVFIDNIYDPRVGISDYGTYNKICQMGYLVFKPEDLTPNTFGIPEKYKKPGSHAEYTDISSFWENIPLIKKYKEELEKRSTLAILPSESLKTRYKTMGKETQERLLSKIAECDQKLRNNPVDKDILKTFLTYTMGGKWSKSFNLEKFKEQLSD